jgi:hypothetical protein
MSLSRGFSLVVAEEEGGALREVVDVGRGESTMRLAERLPQGEGGEQVV